MSPQGDRGPRAFHLGSPQGCVSTLPMQSSHPSGCQSQQTASSLVRHGSCPTARIKGPPGPSPDHPAPGPGGGPARAGGQSSQARPVAVWLRPERGCGLGTTSCLLGEAAGISRTNRETTGPAPPEEGSCLWPHLQTPVGKSTDREGRGWGLKALGLGGLWGVAWLSGLGASPGPQAGNQALESDRSRFLSGLSR